MFLWAQLTVLPIMSATTPMDLKTYFKVPCASISIVSAFSLLHGAEGELLFAVPTAASFRGTARPLSVQPTAATSDDAATRARAATFRPQGLVSICIYIYISDLDMCLSAHSLFGWWHLLGDSTHLRHLQPTVLGQCMMELEMSSDDNGVNCMWQVAISCGDTTKHISCVHLQQSHGSYN